MTDVELRSAAISHAESFFDSGDFTKTLTARVAHRTESQKLPDSLPELHAYLAQEMRPAFEQMGFSTQVFDNPFDGQAPVLLATRHEGDDLPTVLGYGHGDVIVGQDDKWTKGKGPWVVAVDGDRLYGRGTADNKAQHTINMAALDAVLGARGGSLGFNAKFIIEMGEEAGSKGVKELVAANKDVFGADVFIASDGPRVSINRPTLSLGCRGALNFNLVVNLRDGAHHSGNWGGLIADPGLILANALASIVNAQGHLLVPALKAQPMSDAVRAVLEDIEIDGGANGPEIQAWWGEPGLTPPQRVYAANTFNVLAFVTGNPMKPVNAIQPMARAFCQLRFVAGTEADDIVPALREHLDNNGFQLVEIEPPSAANSGAFAATRTEPDQPWAQFVHASLARTMEAAPAVIPSMGGSICNEIFTDVLGIPAIWVPHSYTACSQHAPDEHVLAPVCRSALGLMAGLYFDIGSGDTPARL